MTLKPLYERLEQILGETDLRKDEQALLKLLYSNPGTTRDQLQGKGFGSRDDLEQLLDRMVQRSLLICQRCSGKTELFPVPLAVLMQEHGISQRHEAKELSQLEIWIRYPVLNDSCTSCALPKYRDQVIKWLFDLHKSDWKTVYCFGDYEAFIDNLGFDVEMSWIKERMKKSRRSAVLATQDGQWAQRIRSSSDDELRNCDIKPQDFSDLFIMAFPETKTTVMAGKDGHVAFVHSDAIAKQYSMLVENNL